MGCAREISAPKANWGFEKQRSGYATLNMIVSLLPEPCVQTGDRAKNQREARAGYRDESPARVLSNISLIGSP
jgi:hypothetical protein